MLLSTTKSNSKFRSHVRSKGQPSGFDCRPGHNVQQYQQTPPNSVHSGKGLHISDHHSQAVPRVLLYQHSHKPTTGKQTHNG